MTLKTTSVRQYACDNSSCPNTADTVNDNNLPSGWLRAVKVHVGDTFIGQAGSHLCSRSCAAAAVQQLLNEKLPSSNE